MESVNKKEGLIEAKPSWSLLLQKLPVYHVQLISSDVCRQGGTGIITVDTHSVLDENPVNRTTGHLSPVAC